MSVASMFCNLVSCGEILIGFDFKSISQIRFKGLWLCLHSFVKTDIEVHWRVNNCKPECIYAHFLPWFSLGLPQHLGSVPFTNTRFFVAQVLSDIFSYPKSRIDMLHLLCQFIYIHMFCSDFCKQRLVSDPGWFGVRHQRPEMKYGGGHWCMAGSWKTTYSTKVTLSKFNIAPEKLPSQ